MDQLVHLQSALTLLPNGPEKDALQHILGTPVKQTLEPALAAVAHDNTRPAETAGTAMPRAEEATAIATEPAADLKNVDGKLRQATAQGSPENLSLIHI